MIIVNAILYLSSAHYSILSFNQLFIVEILPYWFVAKSIRYYRKYDIFFNFRFTGNMIFPSIVENQENMIFTLSVIMKMLFFMQCRELHIMQLILNIEKPTTQTYFQKKFQNSEMEWKDMYILLTCVKINTNLRIFQYKLLHNILYLNEMLYKFGKKVSPLSSFCLKEPECPIYLFHSCTETNFLWTQLQRSFQNVLIVPPITPQSTIFGFIDRKVNYRLINHIILILKYYVYKTRENGWLDLNLNIFLKRNIHKTKNIGK